LGIDGIRGVLLKAYDKVSRGTAAVPFDSEAPRTDPTERLIAPRRCGDVDGKRSAWLR
jgi:hypothetical protein